MNVMQDHEGNWSSFRLIWTIVVLTIFGVWAFECLTKGLKPLPMDGITTIGLLSGPAAKTFAEKINKK